MAALLLLGCGDSSGPDIGPPAHLTLLRGATQEGVFGQAATVLPTVLVTDQRDRPIPGVAVTFTLVAGGGTIGTPNATTDANGIANPGAWILGKTFGAKALTATVGALPPVTFTATAIAPDAGVLAFTITDPASDTLPPDLVGVPRAHDVLSLRGDFKRDSLILTLTFGRPVGPLTNGDSLALVGFLELDTDDNRNTGLPAISDSYGGFSSLGIDYFISLGGDGTSVIVVSSQGGGVSARSAFVGSTVVIRIPRAAIGNDDGNFSVVGIIGTPDRPTDIFPNTGAMLVRPADIAVNSNVRPAPSTPATLRSTRPAWGRIPRIR